MITQLTLWGEDEVFRYEPIKWPDVDPMHMWRLAIYEYDEKRFRQGWRPWHKKKGNQNVPRS